MKTFNCKNCGAEKATNHRNTNTYCSCKCQQDFQYNERIDRWKSGGKMGKGGLKRYLSEQKDGCWECGITEWNGKDIVLELEHSDGNSGNNSEPNLSLLCPNCHSQTSTYKNRNRGNGRHSRRLRYAEGKSY